MAGNRTEKNPIWRTMMVLPEVSRDGMKICPTRSKAKQNHRFLYQVQVGRIAKYRLEQKEGYG
ncbi:uncharacterized protein METZ01_LOCUS273208 [marine metagenome]|uniref:Uncharacterized protein n=1 Tax=marine metagenome TaxID=408172 RepID=A0A382K633_9ZZZZ